jgi:hypothetical protein
MLSGIAWAAVYTPTFARLKHVLVSLAPPETEACDAGGGALRSQWRERPGTDYWANLVRADTLENAAVCNICITVTHDWGTNV